MRASAARWPRLRLLAALALAGCSPDAPEVQGLRRHRHGVRARLRADRSHRQAAHARGISRQGGGAVLRLHAVSRRLPDDARRAAEVDEAARPRCGARAGAVRHGRSRARHARAAREIRAGVRSVVSSGSTAMPTRRRARRRNSRSSTRSSRGATPGTYTMDHSAGTFIFDPQGRLRLYVELRAGARRVRARHHASCCARPDEQPTSPAVASRRPGRRVR